MKKAKRFHFKNKKDKVERIIIEKLKAKQNVVQYEKDDITSSSNIKEPYLKVNAATLFFSAAILIVITVFASFFVADRLYYGGYFVEKSNKVSFDRDNVDFKKVAKFQDILNFIRKNYYLEYDENDLLEGAIEGLVAALEDPYSNYMRPGSMGGYNEYIAGSYTGVGVEVTEHEKGLQVGKVYKDSPADKKGIRTNDILTHIGNKKISEMTAKERSSLLKTEGNIISVTVLHEDDSVDVFELTIEIVKKQTVYTSFYDNGIAYVQITQFDADTGKDFEEATTQILKKNSKGIIIDLRNNGGGLEPQASYISDIILPEGLIAYSEDKNGNRIKEIKSNKSEINLPIVILVNQNTASASELVAGAFRDFNKGSIIGVKSFGKALAQVSKTYESDESGIVITIARYFTPSGQCIHGIGIEPTIKVELPEEYRDSSPENIPFEVDSQLQKAIEELERIM